MNELLQKLLETEILTEETKQQLQSAINQKLDEAVEQAKKETRQQMEVQLAEQWVQDRDVLIEAIDSKINQFLAEEVVELKEDIERFRDLEAEYTQKLVEAKQELALEMKHDLDRLAAHADKFLESRLAAEVQNLQEEIEACRKLEFGRQVFESFANTYAKHFVDDASYQGKLRIAEQKIEQLTGKMSKLTESSAKLARTAKMQEILRPLTGSQREVMETLLRNTPTEMLEESYKSFIGRVVKQGTSEAHQRQRKLTESAEQKPARRPVRASKVVTESTVIKTGDNEVEKKVQRTISESAKAPSADILHIKRLAGIV